MFAVSLFAKGQTNEVELISYNLYETDHPVTLKEVSVSIKVNSKKPIKCVILFIEYYLSNGKKAISRTAVKDTYDIWGIYGESYIEDEGWEYLPMENKVYTEIIGIDRLTWPAEDIVDVKIRLFEIEYMDGTSRRIK
jgi:hypothetical protein